MRVEGEGHSTAFALKHSKPDIGDAVTTFNDLLSDIASTTTENHKTEYQNYQTFNFTEDSILIAQIEISSFLSGFNLIFTAK